jgi:hypothetical protein
MLKGQIDLWRLEGEGSGGRMQDALIASLWRREFNALHGIGASRGVAVDSPGMDFILVILAEGSKRGVSIGFLLICVPQYLGLTRSQEFA